VDEPKSLLLRETGIARLSDGGEAVNVGPIVTALGFLTEGRGDDRGTDEHGTPLPDLLSLAFDVVQSIILGGRAADYFRKVKQDFDAQSGLEGRSSLALAKQAATVRPRTPSTALEKAATELRGRLEQLDELQLDGEALAGVQQALQGFRDFGAERWVAATSHLLLALHALQTPGAPTRRATRSRKPKPTAGGKAKAKPQSQPGRTRTKVKAAQTPPRRAGKTKSSKRPKASRERTAKKRQR
jgi:hypothetical protein